MKRMNLRDVPDEVYAALAAAAESNRQSLSAYVVDQLTEVARYTRLTDYLATYPALAGSKVSLEEAADAVRSGREGRDKDLAAS
jgi:hypothetical protein